MQTGAYLVDCPRNSFSRLSPKLPESLNSNDTKFNDTSRKHLGFWIKNADPNHIRFQLRVHCVTAHYGYMMIDLVSEDGTDITYKKFLGSGINDGAWHYVEVDLGSFVAAQEAGDSLLAINGLEFNCYANDLYVDDIILSGGELERSYGIKPGAKISGHIGVQTGLHGAEDINTQAQVIPQWGKYYYHYNNLGTLTSVTNHSGLKIGVYEPDSNGNYRSIIGSRLDSSGITGKQCDLSLIHFKYRWLDTDRGKWISEDPSGQGSLNLYAFLKNNYYNYYDYDGLMEYCDCSECSIVYPYNSVGPFQEGTCTRVIPTAPSDVDIRDNVLDARNHMYNFIWFYGKVQYGGEWDYKNPCPNKDRGSKYQQFGNFNYGATGSAAGFADKTLLREAGRAQISHDKKIKRKVRYPGNPGYYFTSGTPPYGDDPWDQIHIQNGIDYYNNYQYHCIKY